MTIDEKQKMRRWRRLTAVLLLSAFASYASAEYIAPGQLVVKTEAYTPSAQVELPLGTYRYDISWQGIRVGSSEIKVTRGAEDGSAAFIVEANAKSAKGIDLFYRLRHRSISVFHADTLRPIRFTSEQNENSRRKETQVFFDPDGTIRASQKKNGKAPETIKFQSGNLTLDPITAAFLARTLPVEIGSEIKFDVFNGKHRFLITLRIVERGQHETEGGPRKAIVVVPKVQKLTDTEGEKKFRAATLWISDDSKREVLALESKVWIGSVNARLASFTADTPSGPPAPVSTVPGTPSEGGKALSKP